MKKSAYYEGLLYEGPIFKLVVNAFERIDDDWSELSKTCPTTIEKASSGIIRSSYNSDDMIAALFHPDIDSTPGLSKQQLYALRFFRELCQYEGRLFKVKSKNSLSLSKEYRSELLKRLYKQVLKDEISKYAFSYESHLNSAVGQIMPLCADTDLFSPPRACNQQEAMNVFKTDLVTGLEPIWGKFSGIRPVTRRAIKEFYNTVDHWSE
jgi:hypothetical protein